MKKLPLTITLMLMTSLTNAQNGIQLSCPDNNHPHAIDLGLPSGTKWACCNVGAAKPEDTGGYYAWGETQEKSNKDTTYIYYNKISKTYENIGSNIAGTQYDVAHVKWGNDWQMPSMNQFHELLNNCKLDIRTVGSDYILLLTGKNGNRIYLPGRVSAHQSILWGYNYQYFYYYWTSSAITEENQPWQGKPNTYCSYLFSCCSGGSYLDSKEIEPASRNKKSFVRAVYQKTSYKNISSCPDNNHPHAIDLGLPSGTKWACCNVGATKPDDYGGYYAWGETEEKNKYSYKNYKYGKSSFNCKDLGYDISGTKYDVAFVKWGQNWRMPSAEQLKELKTMCYWQWINIDACQGLLLTGRNGNIIFLPAGGLKEVGTYIPKDFYGYYRASTIVHPSWGTSKGENFDRKGWDYDYNGRESGINVRPIYK